MIISILFRGTRVVLCASIVASMLPLGAATAGTASAPASAPSTLRPTPLGQKIWDMSRITDRKETRMELTDLIRFKGHWYVSFHEGEVHGNHHTGRVRVIRSKDGERWETNQVFAWDSGDVREINFGITAEGHLMATTSVYFVLKQPRPDGKVHQLNGPVGKWLDESEHGVVRQSVTWLTTDGENWSSAYACPTGINNWRWDITWYNGMGYSVAHPGAGGREPGGALYRTRDGKSWRLLKPNFFTEGGNEAALDFDEKGTGICLLRHGTDIITIGIARAPYYQDWEWKKVQMDWNNDGNIKPIKEVMRYSLGGPKLLRLSDGRLIGGGRGGGMSLFVIEPETATMTRFATIPGSTYLGLAEHEGKIWVSHGVSSAKGIYLTQVPIPPMSTGKRK